MPAPPFRLANTAVHAPLGARAGAAFEANRFDDVRPADAGDEDGGGRLRLAQLNPHLHCSVLGTCMSTVELRKIMARFGDVAGASDLDIHHDAVGHASEGGAASKALHKALDQRHAAIVQRFARTRGVEALSASWRQALEHGEVPGAYWALLTHRDVTTELRQQAFGDVHMLSHLVGAANRADLRRLVALEDDNAGLRERLERQQERAQASLEERDSTIAALQAESTAAHSRLAQLQRPAPATEPGPGAAESMSLVAVQAERRERAERASAAAAAELSRMEEIAEHAQRQVAELGRELAALERQLQENSRGEGRGDGGSGPGPFAERVRGLRILYVGGRPSSAPLIRDLVLRHGGEFQRHDGIEDRKGLLAGAVAWARLVVFPVDCIDHDAAGNLKRLSGRHGVPYLPLRSAGVASFVAALSAVEGSGAAMLSARPRCA